MDRSTQILIVLTLMAAAVMKVLGQGASTALDFDGSDDYLSADTITHNIGTGDFTWEAWVKTPTSFNNINPIVTNGAYSPAMYSKTYNSTEWGFYYIVYKTSGNTLATDTWYHLAVVRESGTLKFFQDGIQTPTTHSESSDIANDVFEIGRSGATFEGRNIIDEVRFWTVARSQSQIRDAMHTQLNGDESGLIGYWNFDEGSGSSAGDATGNGHNAALTNMDAGSDWVTSSAAIGDASNLGTGTSSLTETGAVPVDISWDDDPGTDGIFAAIQVNSTPDSTSGLLSNFPPTYWELWIANDDGSYQGDITFHYDNISGISDEANLKLYTRSAAGQSWGEAAGYSITAGGSNSDGIGSITLDNVTAFQQYIITSSDPDDPLPVALTSFEASATAAGVALVWQTESEVNNAAFLLDRSEEHLNFFRLTEVPGQGNSNLRSQYHFLDESVIAGRTYTYRLADRDFSGVITYHQPVSITIGEDDLLPEKFILHPNYPNPFNPLTTIRVEIASIAASHQPYQILIFNALGQRIKTLFDQQLSSGAHDLSLQWDGSNDAGLLQASGVYYLQLKNGRRLQTRKLLLIR